MKKISIGSWAYVFNQAEEIDFHTILHRLHDLGLDGVELGAFGKHPTPASHDTKAKRLALRKEVTDHGLAFSGLAADLWSQKLLSVEDSGPYVAAFVKNLFFAEDLGIDLIRVDSVEPPTVLERVDPKVAFDRAVRAWDLCSKLAADRGVRVCWEFEPGFAFNKPSEIVAVVDAVREKGNPNFGALFDTCHAHMCAAVGANQVGQKETLPGGAMELLEKLQGKITHVHLIDSDNTLNEHHTSTHAPFGKGILNFDELLPALNKAGAPGDWWCIDLCFWPDAWSVTADSMKFLSAMRQKYAA
jgi:sugar phosphate isomerase/epimerase